MANAYTVRARWDEESRSWWTDGEDIPGLTCQAATFDELIETVLALAPELLRDDGAAARASPSISRYGAAAREPRGLTASLYRPHLSRIARIDGRGYSAAPVCRRDQLAGELDRADGIERDGAQRLRSVPR